MRPSKLLRSREANLELQPMPFAPTLQFFNHQSLQPAPLELWQAAAERALPLCLAAATSPASELHALQEIEINLVDDAAIARVHAESLDDPAPTDVITFPHGEIFVSLDTAQRQAADNGETYEREVMLYVIHALLHLAGWDDGALDDRSAMQTEQRRILEIVCSAAA